MKKRNLIFIAIILIVSLNSLFAFRYYDPQIARWTTVDPADEFLSPYTYCGNDPVNYVDPDGCSTYVTDNGEVTQVTNDNDLGIYQTLPEGVQGPMLKVGETLVWNSFIDQEAFDNNGSIIPMGQIDFDSFWARDEIGSKLSNLSPNLKGFIHYSANANNGQFDDIKANAPFALGYKPGTNYYGSQLLPGLYVSARDAGNLLAGAAARRCGLGYTFAMSGFGALNAAGNSIINGGTLFLGSRFNTSYLPNYGENSVSHSMQHIGYWGYKK